MSTNKTENNNLTSSHLHYLLSLEKNKALGQEHQVRETILQEASQDLAETIEMKKRRSKAASKKEVVANSSAHGSAQTASKKGPTLTAPNNNLSQGDLLDDKIKDETDGQSIIALMEEAMTEGIRTSMKMYQFDWNMSTQDWKNQVDHAPLIEAAIIASGEAQGSATDCEADMNQKDGITSLCFGGLSAVLGGYGAYKDLAKEEADNLAAETKKLGDKAGTTAAAKASQDAEKAVAKDAASAVKADAKGTVAVKDDARQVSLQVENEAKALGRTAAAKKSMSLGGKVMQGIYEGFAKTAQTAMGMQMISQGITGVGFDSPGKSKEANFQRDAQKEQAYSEGFQLHASGYGEHYNKTEDARQSVSQAVELFLNLLQQFPGTIVQSLATYRAA